MAITMDEMFYNFFRSLFINGLEKSDVIVEEANVPEFLKMASLHQLVALTCKELSRQLPHNRYIKLYANRLVDHQKKYLQSFHSVISLLNENTVAYCILKGYPLALEVYGDVKLRDVGDIDILMGSDSIDKVFRLLKLKGYNQENHIDSDSPVLDYNEFFYEYKMISTYANWEPTIELKTGSSEMSEAILDWREHTRKTRFIDLEITVPKQEYLLLNMFAKAFVDNEDLGLLLGFPAFRNYFELAYYLEYKYDGDFGALIQLARECGIMFKVGRVMKSLKDIFIFRNFDIEKYTNLLFQITERKYPVFLERIPEQLEVNGGVKTPSNIIISEPRCRMQNLDWARYEYVKNHKLAVFSNLSPCFIGRRILKNGFTDWIQYKRFPKLYYRFGSSKSVLVECRIINEINDVWLAEGKKIKIRWLDSNFFSISFFGATLIPLERKNTGFHIVSYNTTDAYSSDFIRDNAGLVTEPLVEYKTTRDRGNTYYLIRINREGLLIEHKSAMFEIRLAESPNDSCAMEYETTQEIVTFN